MISKYDFYAAFFIWAFFKILKEVEKDGGVPGSKTMIASLVAGIAIVLTSITWGISLLLAEIW